MPSVEVQIRYVILTITVTKYLDLIARSISTETGCMSNTNWEYQRDKSCAIYNFSTCAINIGSRAEGYAMLSEELVCYFSLAEVKTY